MDNKEIIKLYEDSTVQVLHLKVRGRNNTFRAITFDVFKSVIELEKLPFWLM